MKSLLLLFISLLPTWGIAESIRIGELNIEIGGKDQDFAREAKVKLIAPDISEHEISLVPR